MALTPFTSNDDVRGLLGVSDEEMADAVLDLAVYSQGLLRELRKIDIGLPALFTTVDAIPALDRTPEQGALHEAVQFFSTHAAALQAGAPLGLIAPKRLTDDKASFERFFGEASLHPNASLITGVICGYRVEEISNPLTQKVRYLDKLVDELAKGRKMEKILRAG